MKPILIYLLFLISACNCIPHFSPDGSPDWQSNWWPNGQSNWWPDRGTVSNDPGNGWFGGGFAGEPPTVNSVPVPPITTSIAPTSTVLEATKTTTKTKLPPQQSASNKVIEAKVGNAFNQVANSPTTATIVHKFEQTTSASPSNTKVTGVQVKNTEAPQPTEKVIDEQYIPFVANANSTSSKPGSSNQLPIIVGGAIAGVVGLCLAGFVMRRKFDKEKKENDAAKRLKDISETPWKFPGASSNIREIPVARVIRHEPIYARPESDIESASASVSIEVIPESPTPPMKTVMSPDRTGSMDVAQSLVFSNESYHSIKEVTIFYESSS